MPVEIGTPGRTLTIILGVQVGVLSVIHDIVRNKDGDNDGAVSVESARFDQRPENWTFLGTWPVNHFRQINWGTDILLTPSEESDNTIVEKYNALVTPADAAQRSSTSRRCSTSQQCLFNCRRKDL